MKIAKGLLCLVSDCSFLLIASFIIAICCESLLTHPLQIFEFYSGKIFLKFVVDIYWVSTTFLYIILARFEM